MSVNTILQLSSRKYTGDEYLGFHLLEIKVLLEGWKILTYSGTTNKAVSDICSTSLASEVCFITCLNSVLSLTAPQSCIFTSNSDYFIRKPGTRCTFSLLNMSVVLGNYEAQHPTKNYKWKGQIQRPFYK